MGSEASRACLSPLPVEGLLITAETRTCKHELDPVPNFSLKTTEEVISDSRNWTWVICSPRYYWRCLVIFPISILTFSFRRKKKKCLVSRGSWRILYSEEKLLFPCMCWSKANKVQLVAKEGKGTISASFEKRRKGRPEILLGCFLIVGWPPSKQEALGDEGQLFPLHYHKSMTN